MAEVNTEYMNISLTRGEYLTLLETLEGTEYNQELFELYEAFGLWDNEGVVAF